MKTEIITNSEILVTEAVTLTNSVSKKSRLTGETIKIGGVIFERNDGQFFDYITFDGCEFRPFLRFETGEIELQNMTKLRGKTIIITSFSKL